MGPRKKITVLDAQTIVLQERIEGKILMIRDKKVIIDYDLASLYGVETKQLKRAVKRNLERFPKDFMIQLTREECINLRCQFGTSSWGGQRYSHYAFTEQGVAMLSSVLSSRKAIQVNIQIMRAFTKLREMMMVHKDLRQKIEEMEKKYDHQFQVIFDAIKRIIDPPIKPKNLLGFGRPSRRRRNE